MQKVGLRLFIRNRSMAVAVFPLKQVSLDTKFCSWYKLEKSLSCYFSGITLKPTIIKTFL